MRSRLSAAVLATSLTLLSACGGGGSSGGPDPVPLPPIGTTGWTVLVYMTADNNLEGDALRDLLEMSSIDSGTDLRFVVQADRAAGEAAGVFVNVGDWTSTKRFVVRRGQAQNVTDLGEVNMGLSTSLSDFVTWGITNYPGDRYMLVFWDHGGGWKGFGWDDSTIATLGQPDPLTLAEIATGIQTGLAATNVTKLDMIGFDACLMATIEVAEAMKPWANYLLASEEVEPGHGWDWAAFGGGGAMTPAQLGTKVIDGYWAQASSAPWNDSAGVTLSLVDLTKLGPIEAALGTLANSYSNATLIAPVLGTVASGRQSAVEYAANPDPAQAYHLVDAWDLGSRMPGVAGASALQTAVAGAVVYSINGPAKAGSRGLSIYFPPTLANYNAEYDALPGMGDWRTFLNAVYGGGANESDPFFVSGIYDTSAGLALTGTLDGATAGSARKAFLQYGIDFRDVGTGLGGAILLGDQPPSTFSGTTVASTWDWTVPILSQGANMEMGYLSVEDAGGGVFTASFPLAYVAYAGAPSEFALWQIAFTSTEILSSVFYAYSGGGVAELAPAPGSTLHALIQWMPSLAAWSSTWELYDDVGAGFDATQPINLDFAPLTTNTPVVALLRVENSAGAGDWIHSPVNVRAP